MNVSQLLFLTKSKKYEILFLQDYFNKSELTLFPTLIFAQKLSL